MIRKEQQLDLPLTKEQYATRCAAIERMTIPNWTNRKTKLIRKFLRDIFKAKWSSHEGTATFRQEWLAGELFVSLRTLKNWLEWARDAGLIFTAISTDSQGVKRTTVEISWKAVGVDQVVASIEVADETADRRELFSSIELQLAESFAQEFRNVELEAIRNAVSTYKANKDILKPQSIVFFLRRGKWPTEEKIRCPIQSQVQAIERQRLIDSEKENERQQRESDLARDRRREQTFGHLIDEMTDEQIAAIASQSPAAEYMWKISGDRSSQVLRSLLIDVIEEANAVAGAMPFEASPKRNGRRHADDDYPPLRVPFPGPPCQPEGRHR